MKKPSSPPFYLVWCEDGSAPRVKHVTVTRAEGEADRLAREHPGKSFVVLAPLARFTKRELELERFDPSLDEIPF